MDTFIASEVYSSYDNSCVDLTSCAEVLLLLPCLRAVAFFLLDTFTR
jgi:hypothetical protein